MTIRRKAQPRPPWRAPLASIRSAKAAGTGSGGIAVLLRHAQSVWNLEGRFTGWVDVGLSAGGIAEAERAGTALRARGYVFDRAHTSRLARAAETLAILLAGLDQAGVPIQASWRLNERHYGVLQGLDKAQPRHPWRAPLASIRSAKAQTAARYGAAQVHRWRRGWSDRPPALPDDDARHPRFDPNCAGLEPGALPATESLADTFRRVVPYWENVIVPQLDRGDTVLVVAHGNTLRALVKHLDGLTEQEVEALEIPTAQPLVYAPDLAAPRAPPVFMRLAASAPHGRA
jgi:2,3-bisphosphoglycerate-dependent phosphoglycerate mutase